MMETVTEPLVPADVDLTGLPFMPLLIDRLRRSKAWRLARKQPELGFYMINLWAASWQEVPASSLENDDEALADVAMCSPAKWAKVRDKALHGFILCSDGRFYHPVVAEEALKSWDERLSYRKDREADRKRLKQWREAKRAKRLGSGETPHETDTETPMKRLSPPVSKRYGNAGETSKTETGTGTGTGQSPLPPEPERGNRVNGSTAPSDHPPLNGHTKPPPSEVDDTLEIVRSFHRLREEVWGIPMPPDTALTAKEISVAKAWVEDGVEYYPALDFMTKRMQRMREKGEQPPERPQFFDKQIREARQAGWPGFRG